MTELTVQNVSFQRREQQIIRQANFTLPSGELVALIGVNGVGKTTLLKLLAGLWQPTHGQILLNQQLLQKFTRRALATHISFVAHNIPSALAFTVAEAVWMGRYPYLERWQAATECDRHAVDAAMQHTDILHLRGRDLTTLSNGERQRVWIARSLATEADMLLLDEPTANLDIAHSLEIMQLCQTLVTQGKTVVFSTHDLNLAAQYAQTLCVLQQGAVVAMGAPSKVLTDALLRQVFNVQVEYLATAAGKTVLWFGR
jgi:iron complex transport system ATP-binding protein